MLRDEYVTARSTSNMPIFIKTNIRKMGRGMMNEAKTLTFLAESLSSVCGKVAVLGGRRKHVEPARRNPGRTVTIWKANAGHQC